MVTSISVDETNSVDEMSTASIEAVVDEVNPVPVIGTTVPGGTKPIPAGIFPTESVPCTVTDPLPTVTLESGEVAETATVFPAALAKTGTESTTTGNPASCPIPPDGEENCTSICAPVVVARPDASPFAPNNPTIAPVPNAVASRLKTRCPFEIAMGLTA
jgi:hypothetical protein